MSTTVNIGQIPYLNCEPFFHGLDLEGINLLPMPPSAMGPLAHQGELQAAPFSLIQSFSITDRYETLFDMGISVMGAVRSILLYSKLPISELSGHRIGVTQETATSSQLLRVILEIKYGVNPSEYTELSAEGSTAFLLIGDQALETHDIVAGYPYRYDLSVEWFDWQNLPFVFARWMIMSSLADSIKKEIGSRLRNNLTTNMSGDLKDIVSKRQYMRIEAGGIESYLRSFRYLFSDEDQEAIRIFEKAWRSLGPLG